MAKTNQTPRGGGGGGPKRCGAVVNPRGGAGPRGGKGKNSRDGANPSSGGGASAGGAARRSGDRQSQNQGGEEGGLERTEGGDNEGQGDAQQSIFIDDEAKGRYDTFGARKCKVTKVFKSDDVEQLSKFDHVLSYFKLHHLDGLLTLDLPVYLEEVNQFYANFRFDDVKDEYVTKVNGISFVVSKYSINKAIGCPYIDSSHLKPNNPNGPHEIFFQHSFQSKNHLTKLPFDLLEMSKKYFHRRSKLLGNAKEYKLYNLSDEHRLVFELIALNVFPSGGHASEATIHSIVLFYYIMEKFPINPGYTILKYMEKVARGKSRGFAYGALITALIRDKGIKISGRSQPLVYYDHAWLTKRGLEIKADGKYGFKDFMKKKMTKEKVERWQEHIEHSVGLLETEVQQAVREMTLANEELGALITSLGLPVDESDEEDKPAFTIYDSDFDPDDAGHFVVDDDDDMNENGDDDEEGGAKQDGGPESSGDDESSGDEDSNGEEERSPKRQKTVDEESRKED